jgi:hypothetical protein
MGAMHEPIPGCLWQWCVSRGFRSFLWLWLWVWGAAGTLELWFGRGWNTGILELRHEQVVAFNAAVPYLFNLHKFCCSDVIWPLMEGSNIQVPRNATAA